MKTIQSVIVTLICTLSLVLGINNLSAQSFTQVIQSPLTTKTGDYYSTSLIDIDNNYTLDLVVGYSNNGSHSLYINDGTGNFLDSSTKQVVTLSSAGFASWGDYNNDCLTDVYWTTNQNNSPPFLTNDGARSFSLTSTATPYSEQISSIAGGWVDISGNSRLDLFVASMNNTAHHLYRNDGNNGFTKIDTGIFAQCTGAIYVVSFGDIENDGDADIFLGNYTGNNYLLINNGNGTFTHDTNSIISNEGSFSSSGTWADFDKDGYLDLFVGRFDNQNFMYHNNGDGTFTKINSGFLTSDNWKTYSSAAGDLDNDGDLDLLLTTSGNGTPRPNKNVIFLNNGSGSFSKLTSGSVYAESRSSTGCAIADYNNDGFQDIFIANRFAPISIHQNSGNTNNFIQLGLFGNPSNRLAVGTRVEIQSAQTGKQVIYTGQQSRVSPNFGAHFGLGQDTIIDTLKIFWPGNNVCTLTDVPVNAFFNIGELTCSLDSVPTAEFTDSSSFLTAHFTNLSDGAISAYHWNFGDGQTSTQTSPTHHYTQAGNYEVKLTVFDNFCKKTTLTNFIEICPDTAQLGFSSTNLGQNFSFTDTSISNGYDFQWDFGDGVNASGTNVNHRYSQGGIYTACLYVTDSCRIDTICQTFTVCNDTLEANFGQTNTAYAVAFTDSSINANSILWDFGDGTQDSISTNPIHTYSTPGIYTVCMIVEDDCNIDTLCQTVGICLDTATAGFSFVDNVTTVNFTSSAQHASTHTWDFGDGNTSNSINPNHTYQKPGSYNVCLVVANDCYTDTLCQTVSVCLNTTQASFSYSDTLTTVSFTSTSTHATSYLWDFGDGSFSTLQNPTYSYQQYGTYTICLTTTNDCGSDTTCKTINVCPKVAVADFTSQHKTGLHMQFYQQCTNAVAYHWDFDDGNYSTSANPSYAFNSAWLFNVCLTATDSCGKTDTYCKKIDLTPFSIDELALLELIKVYPNPANDYVYIELPKELTQNASITISDVQGKVLATQPLENTTASKLDISQYASGIYIINLQLNGTSKQVKVRKE